jgi:hypothetical protein
MSPVKEPHYFSFDSNSKMTKGPGDPIPQAITDFLEYQRLFNGANREKAIGEASTSYLYRPEAAKRIREITPKAKLIAILRHPAERAFSAYMHVVRDRRETAKTFVEALKLENERKKLNWEPIWHFTSVGFYFNQLQRYYQLFDRHQIKVFLYEDLVNNQQDLIKEVFTFLDVNPNFIPDSSIRFNVTGKQKNLLIYSFISTFFTKPNPVRWLSRILIPEKLRWKTTSWIRSKNLKTQQIPVNLRVELIDLFQNDILNLQALIERDLSHWLEK